MALVWVDTPLTGAIVPGRWYFAQWKLNRSKPLSNWDKEGLIWGIQKAAQLKGNVAVSSIQYENAITSQGKADGIIVGVTFKGIYNPELTSQAGFDPRAAIIVIAGVILTVLAANGTLFKFASAVEETAKTGGKGLDTLGKALNPATLGLLIIGALLIIPMFRKG